MSSFGDEMDTQRSPMGRSRSSPLASVVLFLTAVSVVAFIILIIGSIADWEGFSDDPDDTSTFGDVVWLTFFIAGVLALVTGIAAWIVGRRRALAGDVRAGQIAVGWVVIAVVVSAIVSALE